MKYLCLKKELPASKIKAIKMIYPDIDEVIISELESLLGDLNIEDTVIFNHIYDLNGSEEVELSSIIQNYRRLLDVVDDIVFVKTTTCNKKKLKDKLNTYRNKGLKIDEDIEGIMFILEQELTSYASYIDDKNCLRKNVQNVICTDEKRKFGRPIGSKSESEKARNIKRLIIRKCRCFEGNLLDKEFLEEFNIPRTTFYRYKAELKRNANLFSNY